MIHNEILFDELFMNSKFLCGIFEHLKMILRNWVNKMFVCLHKIRFIWKFRNTYISKKRQKNPLSYMREILIFKLS